MIRAFAFLGILGCSAAATADELLSLSYGVTDDGSCPETGHQVAAEYLRGGGPLDIRAYVRSAPSGTDCTTDALSYDLGIRREFDLGIGDWRATAEFGASRMSTSAVYELAEWSGDAHLIPAASLPAGAAETLTASLGILRSFSGVDVGLSVNVVPIDWAGDSGPKAKRSLGLYADWEGPFGFGVEGRLDTAFSHSIYEAAIRWRRDFGEKLGMSAAYRYYGGLNDLWNPAPAEQTFVGQRFVGPSSRDWQTMFELGVSWQLR